MRTDLLTHLVNQSLVNHPSVLPDKGELNGGSDADADSCFLVSDEDDAVASIQVQSVNSRKLVIPLHLIVLVNSHQR